MKHLSIFLLLCAALSFAACQGSTTSSDDGAPQDPIVGTWVSEGGNVAPLLFNPPFRIRRIQATFNRDGSYVVVQRDSAGTEATLRGTYTTSPGGATGANANIRNIGKGNFKHWSLGEVGGAPVRSGALLHPS
jgi:hypothetical protein